MNKEKTKREVELKDLKNSVLDGTQEMKFLDEP